METLRYSERKLWLRIGLTGASMCGLIFLFGHPDLADYLPGRAMILSGSTGHYIVIPLLIAGSAIFVWLAASRLIFGRVAVECLANEVRVTTLWGRTSIRWADLGHVYIRKVRAGYGRSTQLVFHHVAPSLFGAKRLRLPLDATELHPRRYQEFADAILAEKRRAQDRPAGAAAGAAAFEPSGDGFDPDAALARYLARKAEAEASAPAPVAPPAPARPVFGRKTG